MKKAELYARIGVKLSLLFQEINIPVSVESIIMRTHRSQTRFIIERNNHPSMCRKHNKLNALTQN